MVCGGAGSPRFRGGFWFLSQSCLFEMLNPSRNLEGVIFQKIAGVPFSAQKTGRSILYLRPVLKDAI